MDRSDLLKFLETVEAGSLEGYLAEHGDDPVQALDERLQWAAWNFRDPEHAHEANFLMQHHDTLREVLEEGETAWHLRMKRAAQGLAPGGTPMGAPSRAAAPPKAPAPAPAAPTGPPPLPAGLRGAVTPIPHAPPKTPKRHNPMDAPELPGRTVANAKPAEPRQRRPQPPPSISDLTEAAAPPPLSEQATEIKDEDNPFDKDEPTAKLPAPKKKTHRGGRSYRPGRYEHTEPPESEARDRRRPHTDGPSFGGDAPEEGLGLGILKTAYGEGDDDAPRPTTDSGPLPSSLTGGSGDGSGAIAISLGMVAIGVGLMALAGAIVFGALATRPESAPTPPPPSIGDALQDDAK